MSNDGWLNLSEAATFLGVHPSTVRVWADRGEIPSHRTPGGHRRFRRDDLQAWAASRSQGRPAGAQMVIQSTLGRARLEMTEGALAAESWFQRLDGEAKRQHREVGRRLLNLLVNYLGESAGRAAALNEARQVGQTYAAMGRAAGLSLAETVRAYLFFCEFLYQTVYDMTAAAGSGSRTDWNEIRRQTSLFTNEVLIALVEAHERER